jgi:predicted dehydrogenase
MIFSEKAAAVAGTGFIGPVHVEALRRLGVRVKGILGSSPAKSEMAAKTLGLPKAYFSYEEILSDPDVEVVHITTPNRQHRIDSVFADLATLIPIRQRPTVAGATFQGSEASAGAAASEPVRIETEDWGSVLIRFANGARGTMCVSQVTAGRKNQLTFEIACSEGSLAWDSEHPNDLWIGHREKPNELLIRDPSLLAPAIRSFASYPGGHNEGFPDTFKQLYRAIYEYLAEGNFSRPKIFAGFEDGHEELLLCEAILESHRAQTWVPVKRNQTESP